jgi:dTDP-4-dehydrorhamnose reductase
MNGTVAPAIADRLRREGFDVVAWDRSRVPPEDATAARDFVARTRPRWVVHAATGSPDWAEALAAECARLSIGFLHTGSASVFSGRGAGPRTIDAEPDADDDYGRYKIECERRVARANPRALVVRIGWQIGERPGGNNMLTYLAEADARDGRVRASTRWYPACSFLSDTADALFDLMARGAEGLHQADGNPGLTFFEIASALNRLHGEPWTVESADEPVLDHRMADPRVRIASITDRF